MNPSPRGPRWLAILPLLLTALPASPAGAIDFDHDSTGFTLDFSHARVACEACHVQGIFQGAPRRCAGCHSGHDRIGASAPSASHIRVTADCDLCHRPTAWEIIPRIDHDAVLGSCVSCHNNVVAIGKGPRHVPSNNLCEDCHHPSASWHFFHLDVTSNCSQCHNGTVAEGKHGGHITSLNSCEDCHRSGAWSPVLRVDHGAVLGSCFSCHNGVVATGKHPGHIVSGNDCSACHSVNGWVPALP